MKRTRSAPSDAQVPPAPAVHTAPIPPASQNIIQPGQQPLITGNNSANPQAPAVPAPAIDAAQAMATARGGSQQAAQPARTHQRKLAVAIERVMSARNSPGTGSAGRYEIFDILERRGDQVFFYSLLTNKMKYLDSDQLYEVEGCLYVGVKSHIGRARANENLDVQPGKLYDVTEITSENRFESYCITDRNTPYCTPHSVAPVG